MYIKRRFMRGLFSSNTDKQMFYVIFYRSIEKGQNASTVVYYEITKIVDVCIKFDYFIT